MPWDKDSIPQPSGKCHQILSIPPLTVTPVWLNDCSKRHCSWNRNGFISSPEFILTAVCGQDVNNGVIECVTWPNMHHGYVTVCGQIIFSRGQFVYRAFCNLTPQVMLAWVNCGHCGCLITGGGDSAVIVPSYMEARWDVGSGSGYFVKTLLLKCV